jgi:uncharacterized repeat protein (TIGR01451 family)
MAVVFLFSFLFSIIPEADPTPCCYIDIVANKTSFSIGDTVQLFVSAENNSGKNLNGEVFLGLVAPDGEVYF